MTAVDQVRELLTQLLEGKKRLQGQGLVQKISNKTRLDRDEVVSALRQLNKLKEVNCELFSGEVLGTLIPISLKRIKSKTEVEWESLLAKYFQGIEKIESLIPLHNKICDLPTEEKIRLVKGLIELRDKQEAHLGESRFCVSAKYLLNSSKILDALPNKTLRNFGIETNIFAAAPYYVLVAGPKNPKSVTLVENPQAFELAVNADENLENAWIATFGYGLSKAGDEFGNQLADIIEKQKTVIQTIRKGSPPSLSEMLKHQSLYFWGDLDLEGLKIFKRLRNSLPQIMLSELYKPMIDILGKRQGHSYSELTQKKSQKIWHSNDKHLNQLIELCSSQGVDQEALEVYQISI